MTIITHLKNLFRHKKELIVICGPTATGKTALSIKIAKELEKQGKKPEIISADSRQVYRGLDIGTAKITFEEMSGVPHHMIDIADPKDIYTVQDFKRDTTNVIADIHARGGVPILVGGSGMYIDTIIYQSEFPTVPPNVELRSELERKTSEQLFTELQSQDPARAETIDPNNKRRLIRALEITEALGKVPEQKRHTPYKLKVHYLDLPDDELHDRIHKRNVARLENGLIQEVQQLHEQGLGWNRMHELGLEYRYVSQFLQGQIASKEELLETLDTKTRQFAKRQRTWFRKYL